LLVDSILEFHDEGDGCWTFRVGIDETGREVSLTRLSLSPRLESLATAAVSFVVTASTLGEVVVVLRRCWSMDDDDGGDAEISDIT
jgi:hypothetical protein